MSTLYTVKFNHQMGLVRAVDYDDAFAHMERRLGTDADINIEEASEDDEGWFKTMGGGYIDTTKAARQEDKEDEASLMRGLRDRKEGRMFPLSEVMEDGKD